MILISRTQTFAKMFFVVSIAGIIAYVVLAFYSFHTAIGTVDVGTQIRKRIDTINDIPYEDKRFHNGLKYVLLWTISKNILNPIEEGQQPFLLNNCSFINCFITTNKELLNEDYTNFDAIIFNMSLIQSWRKKLLPQKRSFFQKYIFYSMMSSDEHPICNDGLENYFNWTWSYKLYSDIITPFIEVKDLKGNVVAPNTDVVWSIPEFNISTTTPTRSKAVAIVIDDCRPHMTRMTFSKELQYYLQQHNLVMDIYGCGATKCPEEGCLKIIKDYYFYLVYEYSLSEDYLTEEVLKAYDNGAVPILKSGADYTKFLPPESYIDASGTYPEKLAAIIGYIIRDSHSYNKHHLWRKNYTITKVNIDRGLCDLCKLLNNNKRVTLHSAYTTFRKWWYNGPLSDRCYPKGAENYSDVFSYITDSKTRKVRSTFI